MKKCILFFFTSCYLFIYSVHGQNDSFSDCQTYNTFMNNPETLVALNDYSLKISPSGVLNLSPTKQELFGGVRGLLNLMDLPIGTDFQLKGSSRSRLNENMVLMNYQQYYNGIKVEGGGYSVAFETEDQVDAYTIPDEPCASLSFLAPHVVSELDISTISNIEEGDLLGIIENNSILNDVITLHDSRDPELVIVQDHCQSKLAWSVEYFEYEAKKVWIDALDGQILKDAALTMKLSTKENSNSEFKNMLFLESNSSGPVFYYDLEGSSCNSFFPQNFITSNEILNEFDPICPSTGGNAEIMQINSEVECILDGYENLDIEFETIHFAIGCGGTLDGGYAAALPFANTEESFLVFGTDANGSSMATLDVIGHELGHAFLGDFFPYEGVGAQTVHEAISDMLGVYTESICQGGIIDWVMGDDNDFEFRDLANTMNTCFDSRREDAGDFDPIEGEDERGNQTITPVSFSPHQRGEPLGHWFYLITEGDVDQNIPPIGINTAINIVVDAAQMFIPGDGSEFAEIVKAIVLENFGASSDEAIAVWNAFNAVCLGETHDDKFAYTIDGNSNVCEENNGLHLFISNPISSIGYRWNWPPEWSVTGVNQTSGFGNQLNVNNFPKYNYYPRNFEICAYAPQLGTDFRECVTVTLQDCQGDDPDCNDVFSSSFSEGVQSRQLLESKKNVFSESNVELIRIYDLNGVLKFSGKYKDLDYLNDNIGEPRLHIVSYFDIDGLLIHSEKIIYYSN